MTAIKRMASAYDARMAKVDAIVRLQAEFDRRTKLIPRLVAY